ncbi:alpha/beta fold hydrolase [Ktedonosporobacter rubrisoli]|uniref:alpha/beta fold hydrolase n=1 Tax=Ktedonosporobacter rubrisoli TaxID=2509675 RepID=UPI0013EEBD09|nr:alpha/beta fold hydrolase [Ktedonosporobacter rubrisoli]
MADNTHEDRQASQSKYDPPYYEYSSLQRPPTPPTPGSLSTSFPGKGKRKKILLFTLAAAGIVLVLTLLIGPYLSHLFSPHPSTVARKPPTDASFQKASCPFKLGDGIREGKTVTCGYLIVPENRSKPKGAKVRLAVAIFKAQNSQKDDHPVIRLEGGPGGPSLDNWAHYITLSQYSSFVFHHDLIMFDQRGTGYSTPSLKCPELQQLQFATLDKFLSPDASKHLTLQAVSACRDRLLHSGVDLNSFNVLENAADVRDLILALGYQQANLYGVSYGTRLALTVMRLFPTVLRSVVLDSTYPPQKNRDSLPAGGQRAFNVLFQGCADDSYCNKHYPQLDNVFYQLVTDLNANPAHFQTVDYQSGKSYNVVMAGDDFVFLLFSALYVTQYIPDLPRMIFEVRDHDYTTLAQMFGNLEFDDTFSDGMFYSDECSEDWDFLGQKDISQAMQGIRPQIQRSFQNDLQQEYETCRLWNVQPVPKAQKLAVVSDIPTLIIADEYDPITPPENGRLVAQTLKNSYYFSLSGLGHGAQYNSSCADGIISAFEDKPTQMPTYACVSSMREPAFV